MLTIKQFVEAEEVDGAVAYGNAEMPLYVEVDGVLRELDGVRQTEILTAAGVLHTVLVLAASDRTATEAG